MDRLIARLEHRFECAASLLDGSGESSLEAELRQLLDGLGFELDAPPHGRRVEPLSASGKRIDRLVSEGAEQLRLAQAAHREEARAAARRARALAALARSRPSSFDRPDSEIGAAAAATRAGRPAVLAAVSEWAVDEVMVALSLTSASATTLLVDSLTLVDRLPLTLEALEAGRISWAHARVMTDLVSRLPDELRPIAEARLLARVEGRTHNQLRVAARRLVQRLDADGVARRVVEAIRDRRIVVYPGDDGMATLCAVLPAPVARALQDALRQYAAAAATEGDERTAAQRMVDCLVDLVLRPGEHGLAPVQARLTVVAAVGTLLGSDEPGEVDGELVPAEMVRRLAVALGLLPAPLPASTPPPADAPQPAGERGAPVDADALAGLTDLLRTRSLRGTALGHRPHVALADELSGQLVALTDAIGLRSGAGLGPPPESPGYRPEAELDRFVRSRDRRCRFPGCRARPIRCDLDHTVPFPWGPTTAGNLCCLCRHHHRLSHQAPGWRLRGLADGGLEWTTPGGIVATTYPPRFGADDDLPRGVPPGPVGGPAAPPAGVGGDDPPPF